MGLSCLWNSNYVLIPISNVVCWGRMWLWTHVRYNGGDKFSMCVMNDVTKLNSNDSEYNSINNPPQFLIIFIQIIFVIKMDYQNSKDKLSLICENTPMKNSQKNLTFLTILIFKNPINCVKMITIFVFRKSNVWKFGIMTIFTKWVCHVYGIQITFSSQYQM